MLRNLLIDKDLFENIQKKILEAEDWNDNAKLETNILERNVLKLLRKKRSLKKYKKIGVNRNDLKELIELAEITNLELFQGPSNSELASLHPEWCNHCGICCSESSPIFIHKDELNLLIMFNPRLDTEIIANEYYPEHFRFKEDKPCKFHNDETKRCKIYDSRPQVCRHYPLMMIGNEDRARNIINLRYNCNYATRLILEKSIILFDEAVKRLDKKK
ncbi:MAG: YkgJ family cysteine cluster protein [Methanobacterium sp.]|jgi:hypothetical protein